MLNVACVKWGSLYGPEYVNTLFDMVRRNLPAGLAGRFVCFTDDPTGLDEGIENRPLPGGIHGWWNKLYLFSDKAFPKGERVLYFDLDTVITAPLDAIAAYTGPFAILRDAYRKDGLQSSVMAWEAGTYIFWEAWHRHGCPMDARGDQGFIEDAIGERRHVIELWQHLFPGRFRSYKVDCRTTIPRGTSVVFFHGHPRPHEVKSGWVPEVWKIGGGSAMEWIVQSNVDDQTLAANVTSAMARTCEWIEKPGNNSRTALIVGGGPSLTEDLFYIRGMQMSGGKIFATGNTYAYLKKHGIQPDAHVLIDARRENLAFVPEVTLAEQYYASQCHPEVLDAATRLTCWHAAGTVYEPLVQSHRGLKIGAGTTVGLKAIALAYALGHRHLRLFGFDSSYGPSHHAYDQPLNDGEKTLDVRLAGRQFKAAPWMVTQCEEFKELMPLLLEAGCVVRVYGEGLIPYTASLLKPPAVDERSSQLLQWLEGMRSPQGAELGVFTGELSKRLLARPDLSLYLVDSWTTVEQGSDYAESGDFHAKLSQRDQDQYFDQTLEAVRPFGPRARILRMDSKEAAACVPDSSLDFVFIDADHSYEGCKADIRAWLPKLKPSGFISGHDYDHPEFPHFGVKRAVDEIFGAPETGANYTWRVRLAETWRLAL